MIDITQTKFKIASTIERVLLLKLSNIYPKLKNIETTKNKHERFDLVFSLNSVECVGEIKVRSRLYNSLILESKKYKSLITASKYLNRVPSYINFFPNESTCLIWNNLLELDLKLDRREMNTSTMYSNTQKTQKDVYYVYQDDAIQIPFDIDCINLTSLINNKLDCTQTEKQEILEYFKKIYGDFII